MTLIVRLPREELLLDAAERSIARAATALHARQREDGHWRFELEADVTIPAEYVLLRHFRGEERDVGLERLIAAYLRRNQGDHGGWPLVHGGAFDLSASVKAYFALKTIGDDPQAPHMARARAEILKRGGAAKSNVFTRFLLALFEEIPWSGVPTMPVEIMLLPRWFPFHLDKVSYWARTVLVPLLVLQALKPRPANPGAVRIAELFVEPPETVRKWPTGAHQHWAWVRLFGAIDQALKLGEPLLSRSSAPPRDRCGGFVREGAPQRGRRPRRHLSGDGERGPHVRRPRLSERRSVLGPGAAVPRQAAGRPG